MTSSVRTQDKPKPRASERHGRRTPGAQPSLESELRKETNPVKRFFKILGPGLITGASDDDPSGIGTYPQAGAAFGFATLWMALVSLPMQWAIQFICAKIGMVSGRGLAGVLRKHYSKPLLYTVITGVALANTINAGVDIGAIAASINLLVPVPITMMIVPIAIIIVALQIWGSYRLIASTFKWLTLALLAYIGSALYTRPGWGVVLKDTLVPTFQFNRAFVMTIVAILGTTITPYMFFWQANQEVEEEISMGRWTLSQRKGATKGELKYASLDVGTGAFFSNVVMYFIIMATGATLHASGTTNIQSATECACATAAGR